MKHVFLVILTILMFPQISGAQGIDNSTLDIISEPICFTLRNTADYTVAGNLATAHFQRPDGIVSRHRSNFRLSAAGSFNDAGEPTDREDFCSYGPFLPDRQLLLTIRTLFPVFECKTRIDQGEIVLKGQRRADDNGVITWAECFEPDGTLSEKPAE